MRAWKVIAAGAAIGSLIVITGGCSSDGSGDSSVGSGSSAKATLTLSTELAYPPYEYLSNGKPAGFEIALMSAVVKQMGMRLSVVNTAFPAIVTSVADGRYDVGVAGMLITPQREDQVDFVSYAANSADIMLVKAGNPTHLNTADLCGTTLATVTGTAEATSIPVISAKCTAAGKKPVTLKLYTSTTTMTLAIVNGVAQGSPLQPPVASFTAQASKGTLGVVNTGVAGLVPAGQPFGIAVKKGSKALEQKLVNALNALIANGQYVAILKQYGVAAYAIKRSAIFAKG